MIEQILGALSVGSKVTAMKNILTDLSIGSYVLNSKHNAGQCDNAIIANKSSERMAKFRNCMRKEIKNRLLPFGPDYVVFSFFYLKA